MKKILITILFLLLLCCIKAQDTTKAVLLVRQNKNHHSILKAYIVTIPDADTCKVLSFLVLDQLPKPGKFKPLPKKYVVVDYKFLTQKK